MSTTAHSAARPGLPEGGAPDDRSFDTRLLDYLESRGVQSLYFADGSQVTPGSQSLRATLGELLRQAPASAIQVLCGRRA